MKPLQEIRLRTNCTACREKCCSEPYDWVYLTRAEIARLEDASGLPSSAFVEERRNPAGLRLRVLNLPCRFLAANGECSVYEGRPLVCQLFPFYPEPLSGTATLLPVQCGDNLVFEDGPTSWSLADYEGEIRLWLAALWSEATD
jgi:Fe-S-cluster containining protein